MLLSGVPLCSVVGCVLFKNPAMRGCIVYAGDGSVDHREVALTLLKPVDGDARFEALELAVGCLPGVLDPLDVEGALARRKIHKLARKASHLRLHLVVHRLQPAVVYTCDMAGLLPLDAFEWF
eukprot:TRINITY_DN1994_c0_g1_i1.p2 TRINITY_DN1994_c0_g1~~TRINITY_DN1994_c0_g1_i1.p2  ORF type:complete len:123 (+),score=14.97 TRINITY_DN1994_c0_g1_i1:326-694(+)